VSVYEKHIPQWKADMVEKLAAAIDESKMIGLVNVEGVGAKQIGGIRDNLRGSAVLKKARNTLMIRALETSKKKNIKALTKYVKGPVAFIFSDQDPFALSKFLRENKAAAPAKGGQVAPVDVLIPAMNTGVAPGPFISELAALKIPARVKGGVIQITDDSVAVKAGDIISNAMAQMLNRLGIQPIELQLKLIAAYTDGEVLTSENIEVDLEELFSQVILGHQLAINLSVNTGFPTAETIPFIIAKANMEARSLALHIGFFVPEMLDQFLSKANSEAFALAAAISARDPSAIPSEIMSHVKAAAPVAEAPTEAAAKPAKPEKDEEEGESVAGIGGLFG